MFSSVSSKEWLVIAALIILLLFGGKKIPEFFKGIREAVKEFRKASKDEDEK